jgi:DNA-binding transcriptional ArsR family regulator
LKTLAGELDSAFFKALSEPARVELLKFLIVNGPADIETIAERFPQDRSVISRHLAALRDVGIVRCEKEGRQKLCSIDGQALVDKLEGILGNVRSAIARCCPPRQR